MLYLNFELGKKQPALPGTDHVHTQNIETCTQNSSITQM